MGIALSSTVNKQRQSLINEAGQNCAIVDEANDPANICTTVQDVTITSFNSNLKNVDINATCEVNVQCILEQSIEAAAQASAAAASSSKMAIGISASSAVNIIEQEIENRVVQNCGVGSTEVIQTVNIGVFSSDWENISISARGQLGIDCQMKSIALFQLESDATAIAESGIDPAELVMMLLGPIILMTMLGLAGLVFMRIANTGKEARKAEAARHKQARAMERLRTKSLLKVVKEVRKERA